MPRVTPALAVLAALVVGAETSAAQGGPRSGFWLEATAGTGTVRNTCAGCPNVTVAFGSTNSVRLGHSMTPTVLLGLEFFVLHSSDLSLGPGASSVDAENGTLGPIVMWYVGDSGFFLKSGLGLARGTFTVRSEDEGVVTVERTGSGLTFGAGFDIGVVRWIALSANVGMYVTAIGDVRVDGAFVDDVIATVYEAGVGITLR
jgi:hypothetical protein